MKAILNRALRSATETSDIEFKKNFDTSSNKEWLEIIKDIVAISNSGGGIILFGVNNSGEPLNVDVTNILNLDPADITNKIFSYTSKNFSDFELLELLKDSAKLVVILIGGSKIPLIFSRPGTYAISAKKQERVFSIGQIYFRHGAKSEPGNSDDIHQIIENRLEEIREQWLMGVRQVIQAPEGSKFAVLPPDVRQSSSPYAMPIKIVDDPSAPEYRIINPNITHPFRQTDLIMKLNELLSDYSINSYDMLSIRKVYAVDEQEQFFYRPKYGSPQYSNDFLNWIIEKSNENPEFFNQTRESYKKLRQ